MTFSCYKLEVLGINWNLFIYRLPERSMKKQSAKYTDEQFIQEVKKISREIVKEEFPEEEYFDFLFELIIPELQEMEPGKEGEFLREIR